MIMTNKLLPVALVAALIGGSVGAFVMHSKNQSAVEPLATTQPVGSADAQYVRYQPQANQANDGQFIPAEFNSASEQNAYRAGFNEGLRSCEGGVNGVTTTGSNQLAPVVYTQPRVVYRNSGRTYARSNARTYQSSPTYSTYQQPRKRSFWQKHRDKLTVAMGTGGGAILGGLIGGKKGAGIGALAGGGGSALYTYKIRNRNRRY
jgi:hypothetical protein